MRYIFLLFCALTLLPVCAVELEALSPENVGRLKPAGKEVDCIYGDFAFKSDRISAVVAQLAPWRRANITTGNIGGALIDLTSAAEPNDQMTAYYANMGSAFTSAEPTVTGRRAVLKLTAPARLGRAAEGDKAAIVSLAEHTLTYELEDGQPFILVRSILKNTLDAAIEIGLYDTTRFDHFDTWLVSGIHDFVWAEDKFFYQAYAVAAEGRRIKFSPGTLAYVPRDGDGHKVTLTPGESVEQVRRIFPARDSLRVTGSVLKQQGQPSVEVEFSIRDDAGAPVADAQIVVWQQGRVAGTGRTLADGLLQCALPPGKCEVKLSAWGRGHREMTFEAVRERAALELTLPVASKVAATITNTKGKPTPCKVQFKGINGTPNPVWGNNRCRQAIQNLYYSGNGRFTIPIEPGEYEAIVSYGHEYDVVRVPLKVVSAGETPLQATLQRTVKTSGWVSADFHSHSSPSGDNTTDQRGRVLNLLCEHMEFCPCTEHDRIDSYTPHLRALGVEKLMGTCSGIEVTGHPSLSHHNVFPLHVHEHTQDNGGPAPSHDVTDQLKRIAALDNHSEKVIQQDHPDIGWLFFDRNGDYTPDDGWKDGIPFISIIEVHPIHQILKMKASSRHMLHDYNNTIFNWLQILNQGYRVPGVVNTDAHYNHHGSGGIFNWVRCDEEIPGNIDSLEIVRHAKKGHIVMSNGPFLEVKLGKAIPGDDAVVKKGKAALEVKVQCPNWIDIDRVQVLVNGRPAPELNFTRAENPELFREGVVKFDRKIDLLLQSDAHIIVVAVGENHKLGDVMGGPGEMGGWGQLNPVAVSNPIYCDVDGDGFTPNKDTLGAPLPVRSGRPVEKNQKPDDKK